MISKVKPVVDDTGDKKEWFETWFDSPYYHILYKDRDEREAELFLDRLIQHLRPPEGARVLDVACGRGRHSVFLNKKGFNVTGFDLSENSIAYDKQFENETLQFYLHDMREVFRVNYFDLVFNLFSSFGYFDKERDNQRSLIANSIALKKGGVFVFDYFNAKKIMQCGEWSGEKTVDNITFRIRKQIHGNIITKYIDFTDKGKDFHFEEQLVLSTDELLLKYIKETGMTVLEIFGSYQLEPFTADSDRLIIISRK